MFCKGALIAFIFSAAEGERDWHPNREKRRIFAGGILAGTGSHLHVKLEKKRDQHVSVTRRRVRQRLQHLNVLFWDVLHRGVCVRVCRCV